MRSGRLVLAAIFLLVGTVPGITAQTVHEIEIIGDRERDRFRFSPARVVVEPGGTLEVLATVSRCEPESSGGCGHPGRHGRGRLC